MGGPATAMGESPDLPGVHVACRLNGDCQPSFPRSATDQIFQTLIAGLRLGRRSTVARMSLSPSAKTETIIFTGPGIWGMPGQSALRYGVPRSGNAQRR
jgi:hypothetical protein